MRKGLFFLIAIIISFNSFSQDNVNEEVLFTDAELQQMLAPIALYPDSVLTHILIATTYPLEVVQAKDG